MAQNILFQKQKIYKKVLTETELSDIMITVPRGNKKGRKEKWQTLVCKNSAN